MNPSPVAYSYSDATSWSPVTDGTFVWFFDSTGEMGCWDFSGKEIWRRKFAGQPIEFPFNRQHEPICSATPSSRSSCWRRAIPGYRAGPRQLALPARARQGDGQDEVDCRGRVHLLQHGGTRSALRRHACHSSRERGGPHGVPETPIGISMTSLAPGSEGKSLWRYSPTAMPGGPVDGDTFMGLYTMTWDEKYAYWFRNSPEESHLVFDAKTGALLRTQSLVANADVRQWDLTQAKYVLHANVNVRTLADSPAYPLGSGEVLHVLPNWHSNIVDRGYHYFFTSTNNHRSGHAPAGHSGPAHCIGRVNVETGKVEYLEVPVGVDCAAGRAERLIGRPLAHDDDQQRTGAGHCGRRSLTHRRLGYSRVLPEPGFIWPARVFADAARRHVRGRRGRRRARRERPARRERHGAARASVEPGAARAMPAACSTIAA